MPIRVQRIYQQAVPADGYRLLVDRVWPRGVSKEAARLDRWLPEIAPSHELRKWFGHRPERWDEFLRRYHAELAERRGLMTEILELSRRGAVTLLYSARDTQHNQAVALREFLEAAASEGAR